MRSNLSERQRKEAEFHDRMAEKDTRWFAFRAYGLSAACIQYAKALVGDVRGRVIVDCGCGDGEHTLAFIKPGAAVLALDISYRMAKVAQNRLAGSAKKMRCITSCQQMAAEQMAYASESIDVIFGISVLHHLEIPLAVEEFKRVLKPGGRAVFVEPLSHNPVAKLYRALTPNRRSNMERPLDYSFLESFKQYFREVRHKEFHLLSLGAAVFAFSQSRRLFDWSLSVLIRTDERLFARLPWLRRLAWIAVIELIK